MLQGCEYDEGHERDDASVSENENENWEMSGRGSRYVGGFDEGDRPVRFAGFCYDLDPA